MIRVPEDGILYHGSYTEVPRSFRTKEAIASLAFIRSDRYGKYR